MANYYFDFTYKVLISEKGEGLVVAKSLAEAKRKLKKRLKEKF